MSNLYSSTDHLEVDDSNIFFTNPGFCDDDDSDSDFTLIDLILDEGTGSREGVKSVTSKSETSPKYVTTTVQVTGSQTNRASETKTRPQLDTIVQVTRSQTNRASETKTRQQSDSQPKTSNRSGQNIELVDETVEVVLRPTARRSDAGSDVYQNQSYTYIDYDNSLGNRRKETLIELDNLAVSTTPCDIGSAYLSSKLSLKSEETNTKTASSTRKSKDADTKKHQAEGNATPDTSQPNTAKASNSLQGFSTISSPSHHNSPIPEQFLLKNGRSFTISDGYQTVAWSSRPRPQFHKTYSLRVSRPGSPPQSPKPLYKLRFSDLDGKTCRKYEPLKENDLLPRASAYVGYTEAGGKENLTPFPPEVALVIRGMMTELMAHGKLRKLAAICRHRKTPIAVLPTSWELSESLVTTFTRAVVDDSHFFVRINLEEQVYVCMKHAHLNLEGHSNDSTLAIKSTNTESIVVVGLSKDKTPGSCLHEVDQLVSILNDKGW